MDLGAKLTVVGVAFLAILAIVVYMAFRERKLGHGMAADDTAGQQASDARVMTVIFSAIIGGMLLTVIVAYIVFL